MYTPLPPRSLWSATQTRAQGYLRIPVCGQGHNAYHTPWDVAGVCDTPAGAGVLAWRRGPMCACRTFARVLMVPPNLYDIHTYS